MSILAWSHSVSPISVKSGNSSDLEYPASVIGINSIPQTVAHATQMPMDTVSCSGGICCIIKDEISLFMVQNDGMFLEKIEKKTYDICMAAVKQNGESIKFVINWNCFTLQQYENIFLEAIKQTISAFKYIKLFKAINYDELCLKLIEIHPDLFHDIIKLFHHKIKLKLNYIGFFKAAVKKNGKLLLFRNLFYVQIDDKSMLDIMIEAINNYPNIINDILNNPRKFILEITSDDLYKLVLAAIKKNGMLLIVINSKYQKYVTQTHELCYAAVKQNGNALEFVEDQFRGSWEICFQAVTQNKEAFKYVKYEASMDDVAYPYYMNDEMEGNLIDFDKIDSFKYGLLVCYC
jgi:hypothetical protein